MNLTYITLTEARDLLRSRAVSSVELARHCLARIEQLDDALGAFLKPVTQDLALSSAAEADRRIAAGESSPVLGVPLALKDILSITGVRTTCGSRILENYVPRYTATVVRRLLEAGAVVLGKTNMDEFAMGSSNENSAFGPVRNPWNLTKVPGGSSGGSAVAVAAGEAVFALGTDTGGSIRQPAALTGTVGLKPTYGRVSRFGLVAFASSLDQIGPITRSVLDAATVLETIAGRDLHDSTTLDAPVPSYANSLDGDIRGMRLGLPRQYFGEGIEPGVERAVLSAIDVLKSLGAEIREVDLPSTDHALSTYYIISPAEAMANLARYDGVRYGLSEPEDDIWEMYARTRQVGFGREVKRRILLGTYALSAGYHDEYYLRAQKVRTLVRQEFDRAFHEVDAIVAPTAPGVAFGLGEKLEDPLQMYLSDVYTVPANIAGICGLSVPCGFSDGLPVGLQILGKPLDETTILRVGHAFECATEFQRAHPTFSPDVTAAEVSA